MTGKARNVWPAVIVLVIAVAVIVLLDAVWRSPHQGQIAVFGAFAVPVITAAGALARIIWSWRTKTAQAEVFATAEELDHVADLLARAVLGQWTQAASERGLLAPEPIPVRWYRPLVSLTGPVAAAAGSRRFAPLPGLAATREADLVEGDIEDLYAICGGLGSGRLVIAGAPGAGKSGTAVLLVLTALRHREQASNSERPRIPVPVLFTLQDWDPVSQQVQDWLALRLQQTYPMFADKTGGLNAAALIAAGKIMVILDGLDEIAEDLRPTALQALSRQAASRLVVLARTIDMASAASRRGILEGAAAVELQTIDPVAAADYLSRVQLDPPPAGWRDLINRIRAPEGPLARALNSPLTLTLVRDTYRAGDDVHELLDFYNTARRHTSGDSLTQEITDHLLDRVLPAAYTPRPGEKIPPYDLQTARQALTKVAAQMNQNGSRDLQWWRIPDWAPVRTRQLVDGLVVGVTAGIIWGIASALVFGATTGLVAVAVAVVVVGLGEGRSVSRSHAPRRIGKMRPRQAFTRQNVQLGVGGGLVFGTLAGIVAGVVPGVVAGVAAGVVVGVTVGLEDALSDSDSTISSSPFTSWRSDLTFGVAVGLATWPVFAIATGIAVALGAVLVTRHGIPIWDGVVLGVVIGGPLAFMEGPGDSAAWYTSVASIQLVRRWHTPVLLMRFLDDARGRGVLRTVGPVYQFRHARLQDRLARQDPSHQPSTEHTRES